MAYYLLNTVDNSTFNFYWPDANGDPDPNDPIATSVRLNDLSLDFLQTKRSGVPGDAIASGYEYQARDGSLSFSFSSESKETFRAFFTSLLAFLSPRAGKFFIVDDELEQRIGITIKNFSSKIVNGAENQVTEVTLPVICPYPFWESLTEETLTSDFLNFEIIEITVDAADRVFPEYEMSFDLSNSDVSIVNLTNSTVSRLQLLLNAGEEVSLSSITGTAVITGPPEIDIADSIADGTGFLILEPGLNRLQLITNGGGGSLSLRYRKVFP